MGKDDSKAMERSENNRASEREPGAEDAGGLLADKEVGEGED